MRSIDPVPPLFIEPPVPGGEEVEEQAIVRPAIDAMALALPADELKAEPLHDPERRVMLHDPGIDRMKAKIAGHGVSSMVKGRT